MGKELSKTLLAAADALQSILDNKKWQSLSNEMQIAIRNKCISYQKMHSHRKVSKGELISHCSYATERLTNGEWDVYKGEAVEDFIHSEINFE